MIRENLQIGEKKAFNNLEELQLFSEAYKPRKNEFKVSFNNDSFFIRKVK